jgi:16S rRNA (cytosine1402-N4)-methyltransferase
VIKNLEKEELEKIFRVFGEEKDSIRIANNIIKVRKKKDIDTEELVKIIENCKKKIYTKTHKATKIFQALRIFVNQEVSELIYGLINATKLLKPGGMLLVITFHSLEDKIVKFFFKNFSEQKSVSRYLPKDKEKKLLFKIYNKKSITPSIEEIHKNPPSRSAKLRCAIKKEDTNNFELEFLNKFQKLIDIENLGKKL